MRTTADFMFESNAIEGEDHLNPRDVEVAECVLDNGISDLDDLLWIHKKLTEHLKVDWAGAWRTCNVTVGPYTPPDYAAVPDMMETYMKDFPRMDAWEAHNCFELIHPFQDFNGRMGRLLWLSKMPHVPKIPFLQLYYYQTLNKFEKGAI